MSGPRLIVGAMSGTSADGVDAALVRVTGRGTGMSAALLARQHQPYPAELRQTIFRARHPGANDPLGLGELARLARAISITYAHATRAVLASANVDASDVAAVAAHGQTLFHDPPDTLQWIEPALLAHETGCAVVSDFRRADCAAGGQGAPLVPFADYVLFRDAKKTRVLLNLGGIGNITCIPAGARIDQIVAFDTGPANCISDALMRESDPTGPGVDANGALAARGQGIGEIVAHALREPYFAKPPPKSTDVPAMVNLFNAARKQSGANHRLEDLLRSACIVTASTVAEAFARFCPGEHGELIVSGGGARNATMMRLIHERFAAMRVRSIDELGIPGEAKEAVAFALLGAATLDGEPSNVPSATGAKHAVVLGSITPRP